MKSTIDFSIFAGLITLIVLEIVLGIDNLVFIAILTDKLPPKESDKARLIGLSLALIMRLVLLSAILWLVTLTKPLFSIINFTFSWHNLIMLISGIFLLFKATIELHERLENRQQSGEDSKNYASFWIIILQIVILDTIFSLDAVITAVGIANHFPIMVAAVVIAMIIMLLASKPLTRFINQHPTVIVLCLSFLLIIGFNLVSESFGFHIPKGYLYTAIGFSILIELLNQIARRNFIKQQSNRPLRARTADAILRIMGGVCHKNILSSNNNYTSVSILEETFFKEKRNMINGLLSLALQPLREVMTPRKEIRWINATLSVNEIRQKLLLSPYNYFPVCHENLDKIIGVLSSKDILIALEEGKDIKTLATLSSAFIVEETLDPISLLKILLQSRENVVIIIDKFNIVQGLITPLNILEAITRELQEKDKSSNFTKNINIK